MVIVTGINVVTKGDRQDANRTNWNDAELDDVPATSAELSAPLHTRVND